ncbi:MAG: LytTR family DNA-binding domain-containing protein [Acetatifactor sp.]|nr:LytTR family DNA-binding domain-containing protein [Acetatifactor sp.]
MIKVAIVDDNEMFLHEMRQIVESCPGFMADMVCDIYTSSNDFLQADCGAYQLVILDMQIEGKNGYETAKKLRETDDSVVIAFISGVVLPEPEHFRVQPYRYLLKNADLEEIRRDVEELLQETKGRCLNETVEVTGDGRAWRVPIRSILYVAKAKRGSLFTITEDGGTGEGTVLHSNEKLDNWYAELCAHGFEYAHSSYIVNLKSITKIMTDKLTLSNGEILGISRACRRKFHESFSLYFHKKYQRGK